MSALAKVFVIFVFILSLVFFGTSATLFKIRLDWKQAFKNLEADYSKSLDTLGKRINVLKDDSDKKAIEINRLKARQDELALENKKLQEDILTEKKNVKDAMVTADKANTLNETLTSTVKATAESLTAKETELAKQKTERESAVADAAQAREQRDSIRLTLEQTQRELHVSRTEYQQLVDKYDTDRLLLARYEEIYGTLPGKPAPPIDGLVNAVDAGEKLVVLSVGRDDKVEAGYTFTVYRGDEYVGKVQVIKVYPNLAGARIIAMKDGLEIQRGDKASTRLGMN